MPYWSIYCLYCNGYIADALLECLPISQRSEPAFPLLFRARPGAALACPYCNGLIGFDDASEPRVSELGWPVFRYGLAELEIRKLSDGEPASCPLAEWAARHRFTASGTHDPFSGYTYAEQAPENETVP